MNIERLLELRALEASLNAAQAEAGQKQLTPAQARLVVLDLVKKEIEAFYEELDKTLAAVAAEVGVGGYFEAPDGTVYKIVKPQGRFVTFKELDFVRTKREGELRGSLSMKEADEARANGFRSAAKPSKTARLLAVLGSMVESYDILIGEESPFNSLAKGAVKGAFVGTASEAKKLIAEIEQEGGVSSESEPTQNHAN